MKIPLLGLSVTRTKALRDNLLPVEANRGWWPMIRESFIGAFQQNITVRLTDVLTYPTVWACVTLIASDISKLPVYLAQPTDDDVWKPVENPAYSPVLRKPNGFQTHLQFYESWMLSKLIRGNTYVLKARDDRNVVDGLFVLDPCRVRPLMSPNGSVFYELDRDDLSQQPEDLITIPAREIIHDRFNTLYHPLVGLSPIYAAGLAAYQGLKIQNNSANLFANGSNPGGVLTAPGAISDVTAARLKAYWDANYTGSNSGKVAVLGDNLKFERMTMTAVDADLIKQLNWSDERICSCFHIPAYMVGVGPYPSYNNVQALTQQYYVQCLQVLIESIEALLDEGLSLLPTYRSAFDLDSLLRMDSATMMATLKEGVGAGILKPNEARNKLNYEDVEGGDTPYLQIQNYGLAALSQRDSAGPPVTPQPSQPTQATPVMEPATPAEDAMAKLEPMALRKALGLAA